MLMRRISFAILMAVFGLPDSLCASIFPDYSVDAMCDEVDLIIEGTYLRDDEVRIERVYKGSDLLEEGTSSIEVSQLSHHSRSFGYFPGGKTLQAKKLVLFLMRDLKRGNWEPISTIDDSGRCGSCGLIWFDETSCYGYKQVTNPGPYVLVSGLKSDWRIPKSIEALRVDIKTGLANSREWRRSLAIENRTERAEALARYLLKSTSPDGDKGTYQYAVRKPLASLGKDAVPALIHTLRIAPVGERLDPSVLTLHDIGAPANQAIPELAALLADQDHVSIEAYVLSALGSTGDQRAVPYLRQYLESDDEELARIAREAIAKLQDRRSKTGK